VIEPVDSTAEIETPEHVRFRYRLAGPARRTVAYIVDLILRVVIVIGFGVIALMGGLLGGGEFGAASGGLLLLVWFVVEWFYYVLWESLLNGRTPGKAALRLRVVTQSGHPLHVADSMLRNLLRAADFLPFGYVIGFLVMARDRQFRRLGDLVAGTMVVVVDRHGVAPPLVIQPPPQEWELRALPARVPLSAEELDAVELFLRKQPRLAIARSYELAEIVAPLFARRLGFGRTDPQRLLQLLYHQARGGTAGMRVPEMRRR
jgi:uncharacterized RDD family membrane protein YckC